MSNIFQLNEIWKYTKLNYNYTKSKDVHQLNVYPTFAISFWIVIAFSEEICRTSEKKLYCPSQGVVARDPLLQYEQLYSGNKRKNITIYLHKKMIIYTYELRRMKIQISHYGFRQSFSVCFVLFS